CSITRAASSPTRSSTSTRRRTTIRSRGSARSTASSLRACCRSSSREGELEIRPAVKRMSKRKPPVAKAKTPRAKKSQRREPEASGDTSLLELRNTIDEIDANIQQLIAARARCAKEIGVLKGLTSTAEFYRPEREAQVLRKVIERNQGPLRNDEMVRLFRELMSACLAQEEALKVAYLGPEGTFT